MKECEKWPTADVDQKRSMVQFEDCIDFLAKIPRDRPFAYENKMVEKCSWFCAWATKIENQ